MILAWASPFELDKIHQNPGRPPFFRSWNRHCSDFKFTYLLDLNMISQN